MRWRVEVKTGSMAPAPRTREIIPSQFEPRLLYVILPYTLSNIYDTLLLSIFCSILLYVNPPRGSSQTIR